MPSLTEHRVLGALLALARSCVGWWLWRKKGLRVNRKRVLRVNGGAGIAYAKDGHSLTLEDGGGFSTVVGATQFDTTAKRGAHQTSAASVVLFGKDKKVIWQAP
jgi:hypothetical protein